ncbi:MAG: tRNA (N(6)-L-threonylcarbamoyladenosine(37)-C(2))-methylthiotransferase MtaB [Oscillospiraceae bacterium]|nr:tRNA (N(6)-L-threonylcarbamoyladenosine(37)-C(2))-methylthiotransferase MtaB [Oscillospiraceae bacterium]
MNINFITFGCKVNTYETAAIAECFEKAGFNVVSDRSAADIFVINSCTVTSESDSKLMKVLRGLKRDYPDAVIVLTGCYPQAFPSEAKKTPADIITGTKNRNEIIAITQEYLDCFQKNKDKSNVHVNAVEEYLPKESFECMSINGVEGHTRAFMKIQDGCNSMCTYCIIPYSRGHIRSRPIADIEAEAKRLAVNGYREIVLVGINLAFYGAETGLCLADAVETVCSVNGIERVRLGSLEPEMITDNDLLRFSRQQKFCPSFHLSLQSGCDRTLAAMNRKYTSDYYRQLVKRIRDIFPECGITADVMVGFPGETDEDHARSVEFVKEIGFSDIHVFPYSRRKGTKADLMSNQISAEEKKIRAKEMSLIGSKCRVQYLQTLIGKEFPVLFEREKSDGIPHGYAPNYTHIKILTKSSEKSLRKMIFYVKIDKIGDDCCYGHIIEK